MARKQKSLLKQIEEARKSHALVYITGDRQPFDAEIGEDVIRPMYDHLCALEKSDRKCKKLDLFLYSRGGNVSVPWRMVCMFRQIFDEFNVLIPYKAYSAATMITLGADKIVMGRKAELGPIDPMFIRRSSDISTASPRVINVEDVLSYISFVRERANINDQAALAQLVGMLSENLTPLTLGSINREHSHIRLVARKLLVSHNNKVDEERLSAIVESLTEKMYSHGHAIGRKEAQEVGLPVEEASADLEYLLWQLFLEYEKELELNNNLNAEILLEKKEQEKINSLPIAILESAEKLHRFEIQALFRKLRDIPNDPQINVNLDVSFSESIDPQQMPQQSQQALEEITQQATKNLTELVRREIARQSPVMDVTIQELGGGWVER